jgi:hypothetical protein
MDGGYIVGGDTQSSDGDISVYHRYRDSLVVKVTKNGAIEWLKSLGEGFRI